MELVQNPDVRVIEDGEQNQGHEHVRRVHVQVYRTARGRVSAHVTVDISAEAPYRTYVMGPPMGAPVDEVLTFAQRYATRGGYELKIEDPEGLRPDLFSTALMASGGC